MNRYYWGLLSCKGHYIYALHLGYLVAVDAVLEALAAVPSLLRQC